MKARFIYRNLKARFGDQKQEIRALLAAVRPGEVVVDVGANKGSYLYWMSRAVGSGRVVAFEPQPTLAAYLQQAVAVCNLSNVVIEAKAVSDHTGNMTLYTPGDAASPGASLEEAVRSRGACGQIAVEVVRLDEYFANRPGRISVIKIDVEGHELAVFRGAQRILQEDSPVLIFESETRHLTQGTVFDVLDYLTRQGYQGSFICRNSLLPIAQFDPAVHQRQTGARFWDQPSYCNNFILQRDGPR